MRIFHNILSIRIHNENLHFFKRNGGGILAKIALILSAIANLNAVELNQICQNGTARCDITTSQSEITNSTPFSIGQINISSTDLQITNFVNHSTITSTYLQTFDLRNNSNISNFTNYGTISGGINLNGTRNIGTITNYGTMRGVWSSYYAQNITLNNLGIIKTNQGSYMTTLGGNAAHFALESRSANLIIQNYTILINEGATEFNGFGGYGDKTNNKNSHLIIQYNAYTPTAQNVRFKDGKSKILLDFDANFEFGATYNIDKIVTDRTGTSITALGVDFSRLSTYNDIYTLTKSGTNGFKAEIAPQYSTMGILYKSNIKTMNNFSLISNALIYPHKYKGTNRGTRKRVIRRVRKTANLFDTNESSLQELPFYRHTERSEVSKTHESNEIAKSMIEKRINKLDSPLHHYDSSDFASNDLDSSLTLFAQNDESLTNNESLALDSLSLNETFFYNNKSLLLADSTNQTNQTTNRRVVRNINMNQTNQNYYFILTPFVNHNYFFESGRYNLSGLEYGFVTAFSGKLNNSNALGTHFVFSYASLNDKDDSAFNIKSMNINLGLNYKLDLIYSMYLKVRADFFKVC